MAGACSGVMPAHGASSSHDRRSPTIRSGALGADRRDHPSREQVAIETPLVVALVGEPAEELAHEAVLSGVDLDTVAPGLGGEPGGVREPVDDGLDVARLHPLRDLAGVDLGHARWRPQRTLVVRRRSLPTGMVEGGDDERAVRVAGGGDRRPTVAAPCGERRSLVGPVRLVHARALDHDRPAPTAARVARSTPRDARSGAGRRRRGS